VVGAHGAQRHDGAARPVVVMSESLSRTEDGFELPTRPDPLTTKRWRTTGLDSEEEWNGLETPADRSGDW
jgi:hypothetical protein